MRKLFSLFLALSFLLISCDDGDIITLQINFEDNKLKRCGSSSENYVMYNIKEDPYESLTLVFPVNQADAIFNPPTNNEEPIELEINGSSIKFNYRTYDGNPENVLICQSIPGSSVNIINDYEANPGAIAKFTSSFVDDDNDGVPSALEDINGNDNLEDDDTDGDGIPNYKDADDDNDNILTKDENPDPNGDGDLSDAQDTDGNNTPDYLDNDDDGDGVITRYEDENMDTSPLNDIPVNGIARYLDPNLTEEFIVDALIETSYTHTVSVKVVIENAGLEILNATEISMGTYSASETITPN